MQGTVLVALAAEQVDRFSSSHTRRRRAAAALAWAAVAAVMAEEGATLAALAVADGYGSGRYRLKGYTPSYTLEMAQTRIAAEGRLHVFLHKSTTPTQVQTHV